jgi:hypothetical protein
MSAAQRYLKPDQGGLGIFNLVDFLNAQKCSWIKRVLNNQIDNWRLSLLFAITVEAAESR